MYFLQETCAVDSLSALVHTSADVDLNTEEDAQTSLFGQKLISLAPRSFR